MSAMNSDKRAEVTALAINVTIPEAAVDRYPAR